MDRGSGGSYVFDNEVIAGFFGITGFPKESGK